MESVKHSISHIKDMITDIAEAAIRGISHNKPDQGIDEEGRKNVSAEVNLGRLKEDIIEKKT